MNKRLEDHTALINIGFSLLAEGRTLKIRADGYSMYPSVKPGEVIFIEPLPVDTVAVPGEIIAWKRESGFVVHRLTGILKQADRISYITRGDSCHCEDKPVDPDKVAGKVVRIVDHRGRTKTGQELIRKPHYIYNKFRVRILLLSKRVSEILLRRERSVRPQ